MKLHIGSRKRAAGWVTWDAVPGPEVDFVGDCKDLSPIASASVDTLYASHVLEHVPVPDLRDTLAEWFRVLRPGGTAMIGVPDMDTLCWLFLAPQLPPQDKFFVMQMMYGGQGEPHDFHHVGLNAQLLGQFLLDAGFRDIRRVGNFGLFDDTSASIYKGIAISLNMTALKPA